METPESLKELECRKVPGHFEDADYEIYLTSAPGYTFIAVGYEHPNGGYSEMFTLVFPLHAEDPFFLPSISLILILPSVLDEDIPRTSSSGSFLPNWQDHIREQNKQLGPAIVEAINDLLGTH